MAATPSLSWASTPPPFPSWTDEASTHAAEWTAWLTGATLVAAIVAGIVAYKIWRIETQRDTEATTERERAQAAAISSWAYLHTGPSAGHEQTRAVVSNASREPAYDVTVRLVQGAKNWSHTYAVLPPGASLDVDVDDPELGARIDVEVGASVSGPDALVFAISRGTSYVVEMTFRDANNVEWKRDGTGRLHKI
jgi:hypothetical protein